MERGVGGREGDYMQYGNQINTRFSSETLGGHEIVGIGHEWNAIIP